MATSEVTASSIEDVIKDNGIVILDFWADWCGPCKMFAPTFEAASNKHTDVFFGKIDTEGEQALAAQLQIRSIPTLMVFRDGILLYRDAGALPAAGLEELLGQVKALDMDKVRAEIAAQQGGPSA